MPAPSQRRPTACQRRALGLVGGPPPANPATCRRPTCTSTEHAADTQLCQASSPCPHTDSCYCFALPPLQRPGRSQDHLPQRQVLCWAALRHEGERAVGKPQAAGHLNGGPAAGGVLPNAPPGSPRCPSQRHQNKNTNLSCLTSCIIVWRPLGCRRAPPSVSSQRMPTPAPLCAAAGRSPSASLTRQAAAQAGPVAVLEHIYACSCRMQHRER